MIARINVGPKEAWEQMRAHFNRKGARLAHSGSTCLYRVGKKADAKTRCAVGCLIPDDQYDPEMDDGYSVYALVRNDLLIVKDERTLALLAVAQNAHDSASSVQEFRDWLNHYGEKRGWL